MTRFTLAERAEIVKKYYQNFGSIVNTQRQFRRELGRKHDFSAQAIRRIVRKFEREYTLLDLKPPTRRRLVQNEENIAAVAASIKEKPEMSIRQRSAELGIARESIRLILRMLGHETTHKENIPKMKETFKIKLEIGVPADEIVDAKCAAKKSVNAPTAKKHKS